MCNYHKNNNSSQYLSLTICRLSLSQLVPYLSLCCHVCFNLTKGGEKISTLCITGTSNLINVIYCVQKPDTGWQRDIDEQRLMSEEITAKWIFFLLSLSSLLTLLLFMLREYLSWLEIYTSQSWYTAALLGAFILHLYYVLIETESCAFEFPTAFPFSIKS